MQRNYSIKLLYRLFGPIRILYFFLAGFFLMGCRSVELASDQVMTAVVEEPAVEVMVLDEVMPPPPEPEVAEVEEEIKPLPVVTLFARGRILEIEVVQGVQTYLYMKLGDELVTGEIPEVDQEVSLEELINMPSGFTVSPGMKGDIYTDAGFSDKAGEFVVMELYGDIYKARISQLNFIIDRTSMVSIQVR